MQGTEKRLLTILYIKIMLLANDVKVFISYMPRFIHKSNSECEIMNNQ